MIRQKSYQTENGTLYLVATPIGNLEDMTFRAVRILSEVDYIYAEDTRVTKKLLSHFHITTALRSYHMFNENKKISEIIGLLKEGKRLALVTDAGLPGISDPGYLIAKEAIQEHLAVVVIPGASSATTALLSSGLVIEPYLFYGFLHSKQSKRRNELNQLKNNKETIVFYESIHRLKDTFCDMLDVLGDRSVALARELTKKHEEIIRGTISELIPLIDELKGEFVIVVSGSTITEEDLAFNELSFEDLVKHFQSLGLKEMDMMKKIASIKGVSKSEIYKEYIYKFKKKDS